MTATETPIKTSSSPGTADQTAIEMTALRRHFGSGETRVHAVNGIDLRIERGEIVALLGPNGAGKTTTLDMLLGLSQPSSGTVLVFGRTPAQAVASGSMSAMLQTGGLLSDLTVGETVRVIASLHSRATQNAVPEILERTDLSGIAHRRIGKCSGGEQQRVKFALALVADPDLIVLDEPTAGMDATARHHFWDVMRDEADSGRTILFATHYLEEAERFAYRTVIMNHGSIVADAPTAQLQASLGAFIIEANLPEIDSAGIVERLRADDSVDDLLVDGQRVSMCSHNSDAVARELLEAGAYGLEICAPSLETAFTALTEN